MTKNLTVLLVEDDDPLRDVLTELLRNWGCVVYPADHAHQALDVVRHAPIDFSILDMHLPGMTGLEIFRAIRREKGAPLPSILMSGEATAEDARRALELGMFRFLRKPIEVDTLRHCLDTLVAQHFGTKFDHPPRR